MNNYEIEFEYKDEYSHGKWNSQSCTLSGGSKYEAVKKCIELYGLGIDCEYRIVSVNEV